MNKRLIIILILIFFIILITGIVLVTQFGKGCVSNSSCNNYCYKEGGKGVLSLTPECTNFNCKCTCESGLCD